MEQSSPQSLGCVFHYLGWFQLTIASYTGAGAGWCSWYTLSCWSKTPLSLPPWVLYFKTCVTTTKSMEKKTPILSSTRTNIFKAILRFIKNIKLESKIHLTWLNCLYFSHTHGYFTAMQKVKMPQSLRLALSVPEYFWTSRYNYSLKTCCQDRLCLKQAFLFVAVE